MQLENHSQLANSGNQSLTSTEVEVAILSSSAVDDCVVIQRQTEKLKQDYCAYVVPSGIFVAEQLLSYLQTILPRELIPTIVPVSTLPLTASGQIDETALSHLEVRDASLVQQWSEQIQLVPEVKQVAVVVQEHQQQQQLLRPTDLLGECQTLTREENNTSVPSQFPRSTINQNWDQSKLAISHGPELKREKNAPKLLGSALEKTAIEFPGKELV